MPSAVCPQDAYAMGCGNFPASLQTFCLALKRQMPSSQILVSLVHMIPPAMTRSPSTMPQTELPMPIGNLGMASHEAAFEDETIMVRTRPRVGNNLKCILRVSFTDMFRGGLGFYS